GMGWLYQAYTSSSNESPRSFLATNENLSINLTDGTSVILSPGSSLEVAEGFGEHRRSVYLKGKGFFDVEKDPLAFEVHLNEVRVLVHGTSFQVAEDQGQTEVIVKEGVVTVQAPQKEVTLVANEQVSFTSATSEWRKTGPVSENQFAWKTRVLTFSKTAMTDFARDLGKYYEVAIEVDEDLVNRQITTRFNDQSLAEVFEVVQVTLGVKVDTIGARHFRIE
ncbi:MAG: FecR domain-containing protein, partial [Bacteroidota bacterium]